MSRLSTLKPDEIDALYIRAKRELGKIPGVAGVGFGYKTKAGERTAELSFIVDVVQKKPLGDLKPEEVVPREFEGVPVDVQVVANAITGATCANITKYSTLVGGCAITPDSSSGNNNNIGTLGAFVIINNEAGRDRYAILSNNHVLTANSSGVGAEIFQPGRKEVGGGALEKDAENIGGAVANINNVGQMNNMSWVYSEDVAGGALAEDFHVDVATAKIKTSISSWCNTNTGVSLKNEIAGLSLGGKSELAGIARVKASDVASGTYSLYKVGASSGKTTGLLTGIDRSITVNGGPTIGKNLIEITFVSASCSGITQFFIPGDSGSVLVNNSRQVVGLMTMFDNANPALSYACHIHPCLSKVDATLLTEQNWPKPAGESILSNADALALNPLPALRARLQGHPQEAAIMAAVESHREELVRLVNHCRPVTLAWQRGRGPAFMGHYLHALEHPEHPIPQEIHGTSRATSMQMLLDALAQHGSPALQADVQQFGPAMIQHLAGASTLESALAALATPSPETHIP